MTHQNELFDELSQASRARYSGGWIIVFALLALAGAAAFLTGVLGSDAERAWQSYLINFVFWTGIGSGSLMFSVALVVSRAKWGRSLKRLAEAGGAFLPVAFILFWALYFGREKLFHWIHEPIPEKAAWLNVPFFFLRDGAALLLLAVTGGLLVYHSIKPDLAALSGKSLPDPADENDTPHGRSQMLYANIYGILYAFLLTILAFDLMMSLNPHWYSTLFGAYYFVVSFFTGMTFLMILTAIAVRKSAAGKFIFRKQMHKLASLMMGFCLMSADFFYVQFLVIWYGNIPEETRFVITRTRLGPWNTLAWTVLFVAFVIPFILLIFRRLKMIPWFMIGLSIFILIGIWLEKLLLIAPSIRATAGIRLGLTELLITAGFTGVMGLCVLLFLRWFPALPVGDPVFMRNIEMLKAGGEENA